ncbi:Rho termination factor N-terminal domain-containing protein [Natrialba aegyptia]|uniref:Rho termination factor-like N-terminal domain-containing protein n=1 Tax=Natrialba aegyptia DSM 13077 TaxID=1227491 RepID=M0B6V9_9EURY|nr:Rho termination factor N-terminal domain-containing protein [Natrialba aegyptia]ELZ05389.1 hypothetical protein C480_10420 [Natrialba aegyptia DSM 13077]
MPKVEKISGGQVFIKSIGQHFSLGDRADVGEELAAYLCDERGDFAIVEELPEPADLTVDEDSDDLEDKTVDDLQDLAAEAEIGGRSKMNKDDLIEALRDEREE